jgi:hypothetical protein
MREKLTDREGVTDEARRIRLALIKGQTERIETVYARYREQGETVVILAMDPRDSYATLACQGLGITEEQIEWAMKKAEEEQRKPLVVAPLHLDLALNPKVLGEEFRDAIGRFKDKAIVVVIIAQEGKTLVTLPLPPE